MKNLDRTVRALCEHNWVPTLTPNVTAEELAELVKILAKEVEYTGTYYIPSDTDAICSYCGAEDRKLSDWIRMRVKKDVPSVDVPQISFNGFDMRDIWKHS